MSENPKNSSDGPRKLVFLSLLAAIVVGFLIYLSTALTVHPFTSNEMAVGIGGLSGTVSGLATFLLMLWLLPKLLKHS